MKIKWKVQSPPTGRWRSFEKRGWPGASYQNEDETPAAMITCEDEYRPRDVKTGNHAPLNVFIADHREQAWKWRKLKKQAVDLGEAKRLVDQALNQHPEFQPKE